MSIGIDDGVDDPEHGVTTPPPALPDPTPDPAPESAADAAAPVQLPNPLPTPLPTPPPTQLPAQLPAYVAEDSPRFVRGCLVGLLISVPVWVLVIYLIVR